MSATVPAVLLRVKENTPTVPGGQRRSPLNDTQTLSWDLILVLQHIKQYIRLGFMFTPKKVLTVFSSKKPQLQAIYFWDINKLIGIKIVLMSMLKWSYPPSASASGHRISGFTVKGTTAQSKKWKCEKSEIFMESILVVLVVNVKDKSFKSKNQAACNTEITSVHTSNNCFFSLKPCKCHDLWTFAVNTVHLSPLYLSNTKRGTLIQQLSGLFEKLGARWTASS